MDKVANEIGFDSKQPLYDGDIYQELYQLKSLSNNYISLLPYEIIDFMIDKYMYNKEHKYKFNTFIHEDFLSSIKNNYLLYSISYKIISMDYSEDDIEYSLEILVSKIPLSHNEYKLLHFICDKPLYIYDKSDDYIVEQKTDNTLILNDVKHLVISPLTIQMEIDINFILNNKNLIIDISAPLNDIYLTYYYPICKTRQKRLLNKK